MKIHGTGLLDLTTEKDQKWFLKMYEQTHWQHIVEDKTFRVSTLNKDDFKYLVFVTPGGGVDRLVEIGDNDLVEVYSQLGLENFGYTNTDGMAFVRCYERDGNYNHKELAFFCLDNSPYDMKPDDDEWSYQWEDGEIADDLVLYLGEGHDCTPENTLFVTQL